MTIDRVTRRTEKLQKSLQLYSRLTSEAGGLLEIVGNRLGDLASVSAPIHTRSTVLTLAQKNILATKTALELLVANLNVPTKVQHRLDAGPSKDLQDFLAAFTELQDVIAYYKDHMAFSSIQKTCPVAEQLRDRALRQCEHDFQTTITNNLGSGLPSLTHINDLAKGPWAKKTTSTSSLRVALLAPAQIERLRVLADAMVGVKYFFPLDTYITRRDKAIEQVLKTLACEVTSGSSLQLMSVDQLEKLILGWGHQLRVLVVLVASEQHLAHQVWVQPYGKAVFAEAVSRHVKNLIQMARDLVEGKRYPEKIFPLMDMHTQLFEVLPFLEDILGAQEDTEGFVNDARCLDQLVLQTCRTIFKEYDDYVTKDVTKGPGPIDGTIHPLTASVLSYLKRLFAVKGVVDVLFPPSSEGTGGTQDLVVAVARVLMQLLQNLEGRAKGIKNEALLNLFMMNNIHYMVRTVEQSPVLASLGEEWVERHKDFVEEYGAKYHEVVWMALVKVLEAPLPSDASKLRNALKERFKAVNSIIEQLYAPQSSWTIPDPQLKDAVKRVIKTDFVPPYKKFLREYGGVDFTQNPTKYIKYTVEDVERMIDNDLFEGKAVSGAKLSSLKN